MRRARSTPLLAIALAAAGCGGGGGGEPGPACDGLAPAGDAPEFADVVGAIQLVDGQALVDAASGLDREPRVTAGAVFVDRPIPGFSFPFGVFVGLQVPTVAEGACRLLEHHPALCDPACVGGGVCVEPGVCVGLDPRSAGAVTFDGASEGLALAYDPFAGYRPDHVATPGLVDECDAITARADGDVAPAFTVSAAGVAPLDPSVVGTSLEIRDDRDLRITWEPAGAHGRVRLRLLGPNRGHGTPVAAILECDVPDRGELAVPRALIAAMPPSHDHYCAGYDCPASRLLRYHRGTVMTSAGLVELVVGSALEFRIVHNPELAPQ